MATPQQLQLVCDSSTLANYQAWAKPISDWLRTLGFTATSDTGQTYPGDATAVPGSGAYHYEVFKSPETPYYYVRIEYGNVSGANCPSLKIGIGTATSGTGNLAGYYVGPHKLNTNSYTPASTTTQYECNFSGDGGNYVGVMMWRNGLPSSLGNGCTQMLFAIERSLNSSGTHTGDYVTLWICGDVTSYTLACFHQQTIVFDVGSTPIYCSSNVTTNRDSAYAGSGLLVRGLPTAITTTASAFNGSIPVDFAAPCIGIFDYPCTVIGAAMGLDIAEGVTFSVTVYGTARTYMPSKIGPFARSGPWNMGGYAVCMRHD